MAAVQAGSSDPDRVSPGGLARLLSLPDPPLVVDARGREAFRDGTITGAINAGGDPNGFLPGRDGVPMVLILPDAADEDLVAAWVARLAGHPVTLLEGGFTAWKDQGLPIDTQETDYTVPGTVPFTIPRGICEMNTPAQVYE